MIEQQRLEYENPGLNGASVSSNGANEIGVNTDSLHTVPMPVLYRKKSLPPINPQEHVVVKLKRLSQLVESISGRATPVDPLSRAASPAFGRSTPTPTPFNLTLSIDPGRATPAIKEEPDIEILSSSDPEPEVEVKVEDKVEVAKAKDEKLSKSKSKKLSKKEKKKSKKEF